MDTERMTELAPLRTDDDDDAAASMVGSKQRQQWEQRGR